MDNRLLREYNAQNLRGAQQNIDPRIAIAKMEQMNKTNKAKSIDELNIPKEQLTTYIINPIKTTKMPMAELKNKLNERQSMYGDVEAKTASKIMQTWWDSRTNAPYKNILKGEDYTKKFNSKEDLIVYKLRAMDKDIEMLEDACKKLQAKIEQHNGELKVIYSASEEGTMIEKFNHCVKFKNKIVIDPNDVDDMKAAYKVEQAQIEKEQIRIAQMMEKIMESGMTELTADELELLNESNKPIIKQIENTPTIRLIENTPPVAKKSIKVTDVIDMPVKPIYNTSLTLEEDYKTIVVTPPKKKSIKVTEEIIEATPAIVKETSAEDAIGTVADDVLLKYKKKMKNGAKPT